MNTRRFFYITNQGLTLYLRNKGGLHRVDRYDIDPASLERFNAHLAAQPDIPSYTLTDLIEEDYRNETIPHVIGRDRKALIERKLGQLFRGTRYRTTVFQGRQKEGRRDDKLLFTSLTNAEYLNDWLDRLKQTKTPLAGVYSLPLVSQILLRKLNIRHPNTLLLSQQSNDMLRQTFFNEYDLKNSRLSHLSGADLTADLAFLLDIIQKNQRYLHRLRLLPLGTRLTVYFLAHRDTIGHRHHDMPDAEELSSHIIDMGEAAQRIGLKHQANTLDSEQFFVWLLSRATPSTNYAPQSDRRYFLMHQTRRYAYRASIAATIAGLAWSGLNLYHSAELRDDTALLQSETRQLDQRLSDAMAAMPQTPLPPDDMQSVVETNDRLTKRKSNPERMMIALSRALAVHPNLQLDEIEWSVTEAPVNDENNNENSDDDTSRAVYQQALVKGHITPFQEDFHHAFALVTGFIKSLRRDRAFLRVEAIAMPLNTDPSSILNGNVASSDTKTTQRFEIRAVLKVDDDAV